MANSETICKFAPVILALAVILGTPRIEGRKLNSVIHQEIEASKDKLHPTDLGNSPEIGHSRAEYKKDLSCATLGDHSPAIRHASAEYKEDLKSTTPVDHSPRTGHVFMKFKEDLKSTPSGSVSPRVGHSSSGISNEDFEQDSLEAFHHTQPGHSPGIGHPTTVGILKDTIESKKNRN